MTANIKFCKRTCEACEECCSVVAVAELKKPYHTRCGHQTGKGCAIYGNHPVECRDYRCAWLQGILPEEMRPDKIGILIDAEGGADWIVIQECHHNALDTAVGRGLINEFLGLAENLRCGVRIEPYGAHMRVSPNGDQVPGLYKEIAPKVYLYVGQDERGVSPAPPRQQTRSVGTNRNDLCPCGSGKKYKHCCFRRADVL